MDADAGRLELATSAVRVVVDLERGGQLLHLGRAGGSNALFHEAWDSPQPATATSGYGSGDLDWLSHYRGGWQVMFPNAGPGCVVDGVAQPLHGEAGVTSPEVRDVAPGSVTLEWSLQRRLRLERLITLGRERPVVRIEEQAINESARPVAVAWGQHPALAARPGMRIDLPGGALHVDADFDDPDADLEPGTSGSWPMARSRDGSSVDLSIVPAGPLERVCYLPDRPTAWAALRDPGDGHGVALAWDGKAYPHLWLWEQLGGGRFPFEGRARIVALEPVSCWPGDGLAAAIERGRALMLPPHASMRAWCTVSLFEARDSPVTGVDADGQVSLAA